MTAASYSLMALLEAGSKEKEEEPGPSDGGGTFSQEYPESLGTVDDAVLGPSSIGGSSQPDREPTALTKAGEDQPLKASSDESQQITSNKEQLPLPHNPRMWRMEHRKVQRRFARLLLRKRLCPSSQGIPDVGWFSWM